MAIIPHSMAKIFQILKEEWQRTREVDSVLRAENKPMRDFVKKDLGVLKTQTGLDGTLHTDLLPEDLYDTRTSKKGRGPEKE